MTDGEYLEMQGHVTTISALVADMDLAGFINRINRAETMGIFHTAPADYQKALPTLQGLKDLAHALAGVKRVAVRLRDDGGA